MSETKLLNCPFCGGEAELVGEIYHWVLCKECKGGSHAFKTVEEAIKAWNTRKPMERIVERLEEENVLAEKEMDRAREQNPLQYERCDSYICAIDNAIEIVKEEGALNA